MNSEEYYSRRSIMDDIEDFFKKIKYKLTKINIRNYFKRKTKNESISNHSNI